MAKSRTDGYNALFNYFFSEQENSTGWREILGARMKDIRRIVLLSQGQNRSAQSHDAMARKLDSDGALHMNAGCFAVLGLQTAFICSWCTTASELAL